VDAHGVTRTEVRHVWFELLNLELTNDLGNHRTPSFSLLLLGPASWNVGGSQPSRGATAPLAQTWLQRVTVESTRNPGTAK
jgi:hypothetical protein